MLSEKSFQRFKKHSKLCSFLRGIPFYWDNENEKLRVRKSILSQISFQVFIVWNIANLLDISRQILVELSKPEPGYVGLVVMQIALVAWSLAAGSSYTLYSKRNEIVWLFDQLSARNKISHEGKKFKVGFQKYG